MEKHTKEEGNIVSIEFLRAETLKEHVRIKNDLPTKGFVKSIVTRESPAKVRYEVSLSPINDLRAVFKSKEGKAF